MNITLPDTIRDWVEANASLENRTPDEFVLGLVEKAQRESGEEILRQMAGAKNGEAVSAQRLEAARKQLEVKLLEGLESGPATPMDWDAIRQRVTARLAQQQGE